MYIHAICVIFCSLAYLNFKNALKLRELLYLRLIEYLKFVIMKLSTVFDWLFCLGLSRTLIFINYGTPMRVLSANLVSVCGLTRPLTFLGKFASRR